MGECGMVKGKALLMHQPELEEEEDGQSFRAEWDLVSRERRRGRDRRDLAEQGFPQGVHRLRPGSGEVQGHGEGHAAA